MFWIEPETGLPFPLKLDVISGVLGYKRNKGGKRTTHAFYQN